MIYIFWITQSFANIPADVGFPIPPENFSIFCQVSRVNLFGNLSNTESTVEIVLKVHFFQQNRWGKVSKYNRLRASIGAATMRFNIKLYYPTAQS